MAKSQATRATMRTRRFPETLLRARVHRRCDRRANRRPDATALQGQQIQRRGNPRLECLDRIDHAAAAADKSKTPRTRRTSGNRTLPVPRKVFRERAEKAFGSSMKVVS